MSEKYIKPEDKKRFEDFAKDKIPSYPFTAGLKPEEHKMFIELSRSWLIKGLEIATIDERQKQELEAQKTGFSEDEIMTQVKSLLRRIDQRKGRTTYSNRSYATIGVIRMALDELKEPKES